MSDRKMFPYDPDLQEEYELANKAAPALPDVAQGFVLSIEEFDNVFVARGLFGLVASDKTREGAIEKLRKLTTRTVEHLPAGAVEQRGEEQLNESSDNKGK